MATKITRQVLEAYLNCKTKAYLKLMGQSGIVSDYEALLISTRQEVRQRAIGTIFTLKAVAEVVTGVPLTAATLRSGLSYVLNATLEDDVLSVSFDCLKRVDGTSKLGDFHYLPMLFHEGRKVAKEQRLLLELYGLLLSRLQGQMPAVGIVWHGKECRTTRVRLNGDLRKTERLLRDVKEMVSGESPPNLILNDHCQVCEFRQRCHDQAVQEDNISLLRGMGQKEIKRFARKGIFTIIQLAHTFRPRRRGKRTPPKNNRRYHALHALSLRDKRVYVFGTPQLPEAPINVYLDIEGDPEQGFDYLVGMIVVEGESEHRYSFWADKRDDEDRIFEQFLRTVTQFQDFRVFAYGGYERAFLMRMRKRAIRKAPVDRVLKALVNTLSLLYSHVYFPTYSNGLKEVAACLGGSWTDPGASGIQSLVWRVRWEETHSEEWKQKLITYNLEDCAALKRVNEFLRTCCAKPAQEANASLKTESIPAIAWVEELDRLGTVRRRENIAFFHPDFDHVNKHGHFDYQRQRVFVRTSKLLKKSQRTPKTFRNRKLRINQRVQIDCHKCPSCGNVALIRGINSKHSSTYRPTYKRAFDLVFTAGGIKRKVIECRSSVHCCVTCGHTFIPECYKRLAKHFHGLMSWAIYQHIAHRISPNTLEVMLKNFFGLSVSGQEIDRFKPMMTRYYQISYNAVFDKILRGELLHLDETDVRLRNGKGYVWVFTTSEEVIYMFRPTREGEFLVDLLKDFHGVLVTDFYSAYDSLVCPQQKCLIHLMRDMNQELLNNPFDEELQAITGPFGGLLRKIVDTIDQYGLKRRHLERHEADVTEFFKPLMIRSCRSEVAETLRTRLVKYQDKLFTFLRYDGVPWNNNNAENAIRQFAYYREGAAGRLKEHTLSDHLVLLSISQTCRYRGINFLKFLLSRERNIDVFCKHPQRKRRCPSIEVYPKGIVRPDFRPPRVASSEPETQRKEGRHVDR
jgi:predicted RecB family nuclease